MISSQTTSESGLLTLRESTTVTMFVASHDPRKLTSNRGLRWRSAGRTTHSAT